MTNDSIQLLLSLTDSKDLAKLIKLTSSDIGGDKPDYTRLSNRSWRLFNHQTFCDYSDKFEVSNKFQDLSQSFTLLGDKKPLLTQTNTSQTLYSHSSNLSLHKNTYESNSEMSNIEERDENGPTINKLTDDAKNIFFIANSPSPPSNKSNGKPCNGSSSSLSSVKPHFNSDNVTKTLEVKPTNSSLSPQDAMNAGPSCSPSSSCAPPPPPLPGGLKRQDSLFNNTNNPITSKTLEYSSSDLSDDGIDEEDEDDILDDSISLNEDPPAKLDNPNDRNNSTVSAMTSKSDNRSMRKNSDDNDSEWLSVSSEEEKNEPDYHPLQFNKRIPPSRKISSDTITLHPPNKSNAVHENSNGSPPSDHLGQNFKPRSLLSGLFLNEMANRHHHYKNTPNNTNRKPILKRSSTTGIITVGQENVTSSDCKAKIQRPSIMISKKFNSLVDIPKNYPHRKNKNQNDQHPDEDYSLLNKQSSIVGISDFNVTSNSLPNHNENSPSSSSNGGSSLLSPNSTNHHHHPVNLSSSLSKFSVPKNNSFKNMLSKSSINLTGLFSTMSGNSGTSGTSGNSGQLNTNKKTGSRPNLTTEKSKSSFGNSSESSMERSSFSPFPGNQSTVSESIFEEEGRRGSASEPTKNPQLENKDLEHHQENEQSQSQSQSQSDDKLIGIRLSPKSSRKSMFDNELSTSLKESLKIDYKLGKVPLPKKVIGQRYTDSDNSINDINNDDYHSKGW